MTRLASNEIFPPSNKIHGEVGRAKDLSAPRYIQTVKWVDRTVFCPSVSIKRERSHDILNKTAL